MIIKNITNQELSEIAAYVCGSVISVANIGEASCPVTKIRYQGSLRYYQIGQMADFFSRKLPDGVAVTTRYDAEWVTEINGCSPEQLKKIEGKIEELREKKRQRSEEDFEKARDAIQQKERAQSQFFNSNKDNAIVRAHKFLGLEKIYPGQVSMLSEDTWIVEVYLSGGKRIVHLNAEEVWLPETKINKQKVKELP